MYINERAFRSPFVLPHKPDRSHLWSSYLRSPLSLDRYCGMWYSQPKTPKRRSATQLGAKSMVDSMINLFLGRSHSPTCHTLSACRTRQLYLTSRSWGCRSILLFLIGLGAASPRVHSYEESTLDVTDVFPQSAIRPLRHSLRKSETTSKQWLYHLLGE